ncbi:hypothetical protein [Alteraurantiacibacter aquimixticola]|uniref:hypothetical protein n=1 Tax=Alteraurantiacibacter aquimixticola TaxID=2489173 RepID=UPI00145C10E4|nr:hypothetical protein [Alteraurantiacibacter aquimixticola]
MGSFFLIIAIAGMIGLIMFPHSKNRWENLYRRGSAATAFGVGLFGSVFMLLQV